MKRQLERNPSYILWGKVIQKDFRVNKSVYLLLLPVLVYYFVFCYVPMYGALIAFKDFSPKLGILGSKWAGLKHFMYF